MTAPHFFVDSARPLEPGTHVTLSPEDSRHALRSLRLRPGEAVTVSDDEGMVATGSLAEPEDGLAVVAVDAVRRAIRRPPIVSVAMAPPKGDRLSWAVQKLAELGVDEFVPLLTARTRREWDPDRADRVAGRLGQVARQAGMQSRRPFVTRVLPAIGLEEALGVSATVVVLWEGADAGLSLPDEPSGVRLLIGPEGSFTDDEIELIRSGPGSLASLGEGILRTETAAVVGAGLVLARYGRLG
ncbi:MAG TPA: RsmE family RNA methyltransferase [Actinomycetota bacterium]|nr:RsmE family RNA methyltransferase [Actinomycetota bacterium]